ncbi:MAG: hypothetical protein ACFB15_03830 [Cyclobacteriaceae bacterium]
MTKSYFIRIKEYIKLQRIKLIESRRSIEDDFNGRVMCLFSSPRGGSTWLLEALNNMGEFVPINEPFFQGKLRTDGIMPSFSTGRPYLNELNFWFHQPLAEGYKSVEEEVVFRRLFSGKYLHPDLTRYSSIDQLRNAKRFLVKFCYGNLMLPWIVENFNVAAICLIRHPCAVIASQLNVKGAFDHIIACPKFDFPAFFNVEYFSQFDPILRNISSPEGILAAIWSMTVKHVVEHPANNLKWHTLKYEDLLRDPAVELNKIVTRYPEFEWSGATVDANIPSQSTLDPKLESYLLNNSQETKWKSQLTIKQIDNIFEVVDSFGVIIYN